MAGAVGISVLDVMEEENTMENSKVVGTYLLQGLVKLVNK
jgi:4-aminobutyrate aminotransferase-like enzyme